MSTARIPDTVHNGHPSMKVNSDAVVHISGSKKHSLYSRAKVAVINFLSRRKRKGRTSLQQSQKDTVVRLYHHSSCCVVQSQPQESFSNLDMNNSGAPMDIDDRLNVVCPLS
jgi:hypothetical protein